MPEEPEDEIGRVYVPKAQRDSRRPQSLPGILHRWREMRLFLEGSLTEKRAIKNPQEATLAMIRYLEDSLAFRQILIETLTPIIEALEQKEDLTHKDVKDHAAVLHTFALDLFRLSDHLRDEDRKIEGQKN